MYHAMVPACVPNATTCAWLIEVLKWTSDVTASGTWFVKERGRNQIVTERKEYCHRERWKTQETFGMYIPSEM